MSLRMTAVMATFGVFPAAMSDCCLALRSTLKRIAARAGVERARPQACAAAADDIFAFPPAAFTGEGRGEACGRPAFESSEFGRLDQPGESGGGADAWNADAALEARHEAGTGFNEPVAFGVDGGEFLADLFEPPRGLTLAQGDGEVFLAVLCGDAILDERAACRCRSFIWSSADQGAHERREQGAEAAQHDGVDPIGFGAPAQGFGVSPRLARIDLDHGRPLAPSARSKAR